MSEPNKIKIPRRLMTKAIQKMANELDRQLIEKLDTHANNNDKSNTIPCD